jgi:transposase
VIGKNWLFSYTPKGAMASAQLYSLVETAKANDLEPYAWLRHALERLPTAASVEDYEALMP